MEKDKSGLDMLDAWLEEAIADVASRTESYVQHGFYELADMSQTKEGIFLLVRRKIGAIRANLAAAPAPAPTPVTTVAMPLDAIRALLTRACVIPGAQFGIAVGIFDGSVRTHIAPRDSIAYVDGDVTALRGGGIIYRYPITSVIAAWWADGGAPTARYHSAVDRLVQWDEDPMHVAAEMFAKRVEGRWD